MVISALLLLGCTQPQTVVYPSETVRPGVANVSGTVSVTVSPPATNTTKPLNTTITTIPPTTFDNSQYSSDYSGAAQPDPTLVKTDAGYISGLQQNGLMVYLGIPFAAPPIGDLRWRPPA